MKEKQRIAETGLRPGITALEVSKKFFWNISAAENNFEDKSFRKMADDFANVFFKHCKSIFSNPDSERTERTTALALPSHTPRFDGLIDLAPLFAWLYTCDPVNLGKNTRFMTICEHYGRCINPIYLKDIKVLTENFRQMVGKTKGDDGGARLEQHATAFSRVLAALIKCVDQEQDFVSSIFGFGARHVAALEAASGTQYSNEEEAAATALVREIFNGMETELLETELLNLIDFCSR